MRLLVALLAVLIGVGVAYIGLDMSGNHKVGPGVYQGVVLVADDYYVVQGTVRKVFNVSLIDGVVVLGGGGYLINGTKLDCYTASGLYEGTVVYRGDGVLLSGNVTHVYDVSIVRGRVMLFNACVYWPR